MSSRIIPDSLHQQVVEFIESCHEGEWNSSLDRDAIVSALAAAPIAQSAGAVPATDEQMYAAFDEHAKTHSLVASAWSFEAGVRWAEARLFTHPPAVEPVIAQQVAPAPALPRMGLEEAQEAGLFDAPIEVAPAPQPERNIKRPDALTQFVQRLLSTPGCERLKEWAEIGPVQRAAVEQLVSLVAPAPQPEGIVQPATVPGEQPSYFCKKCGYRGPVQVDHQRPNGSGECGYIAALAAAPATDATASILLDTMLYAAAADDGSAGAARKLLDTHLSLRIDPTQGEWQPIATAPKDGTSVLLWVGEAVIGYFATGKQFPESTAPFNNWTTGREYAGGHDCGYASIGKPTHWMPLPSAPGAAQEGG